MANAYRQPIKHDREWLQGAYLPSKYHALDQISVWHPDPLDEEMSFSYNKHIFTTGREDILRYVYRINELCVRSQAFLAGEKDRAEPEAVAWTTLVDLEDWYLHLQADIRYREHMPPHLFEFQ